MTPSFPIENGRPFLSHVLPIDVDRFEPGSLATKRWYAIWRSGASLSRSAYPAFAAFVSAASMPQTPPSPHKPRYQDGLYLDDNRPGLADVQWLQRFAKRQNAEFQMMVADYLARRDIVGAQKTMRELVLLALSEPKAFPDGIFRVADPNLLSAHRDPDAPEWPPIEKIVDRVATYKNPRLVVDLLTLLQLNQSRLPVDRDRLLPLLAASDDDVRRAALATFEAWHGKSPKDADQGAWHQGRARLSKDELKAAQPEGSGS